jgi:Rod binding domain-containing protein
MILTGATAAAANSERPVAQPRLVQAAHEFEAQMMAELMKPLTRNDSLMGDGDDSGSGSGGALGDFASAALGRALSEHGGVGIATSIVQQLSHSGNHSQPAQVTGELHGNTIIKRLE